MKGNLVVLQSGGPTSVINSSLYGVILQAKKEKDVEEVYGSLNGIDGIINDELINLSLEDEKELKYLLTTPGAALGSTRHRLSNDLNDKVYQDIYDCFVKHNIRYFILIGGNDSMDTANKVANYFKTKDYKCNIIGVPKTIDNDLIITDHTPGYGSAIKYISNVFAEVKVDMSSYKKGKVTIVEVMGRDAGWLTAGSKLASLINLGPDLIYLPESNFSLDKFLKDVEKVYKENKQVLVAVSEGVKEDGQYILEKYGSESCKDGFGHVQLGGVAACLADIVNKRLNLPIRAMELNLPQRCSTHLPCKTDIMEAKKCGEKGVKLVVNGQTGKMVIMKRVSTNPYKIAYDSVDLNLIANQIKTIDQNWIINGNDVSNDFILYAKELIKGEIKIKLNDGLARFVKLSKIKVK